MNGCKPLMAGAITNVGDVEDAVGQRRLKPAFKAPGTHRLKLRRDKLLSKSS